MKKSKKIVFYSLILTILVVAGIAIWFSTLEKCEPPVKPKSVPQDAIWAGGYDGGCFFLLQSEYSDTSRFTVYEEHKGDIWYDGYFYCDNNDFKQIAELDWRDLVTCYNGLNVFMKNPYDGKREIVWHKVMPANIPDPNEVYWVEGDNGGWFFLMKSTYSDTSHFVIYEGNTGEILHDGLFSCGKKDFECIAESEWSNLLKQYNGQEIVMTNPEDKSRHILWHPIE